MNITADAILGDLNVPFVRDNEHYNVMNGKLDIWVTGDKIMFTVDDMEKLTAIDSTLMELGVKFNHKDGFLDCDATDRNLLSVIKVATDIIVLGKDSVASLLH